MNADVEHIKHRKIQMSHQEIKSDSNFYYINCGKKEEPRKIKVSFSAQYLRHEKSEKSGQIYKSTPNLNHFKQETNDKSKNQIKMNSSIYLKQRYNMKLNSDGYLKPGRKNSVKLKSYVHYLKQGRSDIPKHVVNLNSHIDDLKIEQTENWDELVNVIPDYDNLQNENIGVLSRMAARKSGDAHLNGYSGQPVGVTGMKSDRNHFKSRNENLNKLHNGDTDYLKFGNNDKPSQVYKINSNIDYLKLGKIIFECQEFLDKKGQYK